MPRCGFAFLMKQKAISLLSLSLSRRAVIEIDPAQYSRATLCMCVLGNQPFHQFSIDERASDRHYTQPSLRSTAIVISSRRLISTLSRARAQ